MRVLPWIVEQMWREHPNELRRALQRIREGSPEEPVGKYVIRPVGSLEMREGTPT